MDDTASGRRSRFEIVGWGLGLYTLTNVAGAILATLPSIAALVAQSVLSDWGTARLGVTWSDPAAPRSRASIGRRAGVGASVGIAAACAVVGTLVATQAAALHFVSPSLMPLLLALVMGGVIAMRDELLHHGLVLRALADLDAPVAKAIACGVTSAAAAFGEMPASPAIVLARGLFGIVCGALWLRDRGAWAAWAAHAAWLFATNALLQGGLFQAHVASGVWAGGEAGPLGGFAAGVALVPLAVGALVGIAPRTPRAARDVVSARSTKDAAP